MSLGQKVSKTVKASTRTTGSKSRVTKPKEPKKKEQEKKEGEKKVHKTHSKVGIILVRGLIGIRKDIKGALFSLRLRRKHACVVVEDNPSNRAATVKCKDYVTYGELDDATLKLLLDKRGKKDPVHKEYYKKFFLLHPPRGGFERKGIKVPFNKGGALGYRGPKVNDLIKKTF